jgi:branched-chain amino acid transport system substrate-binding protein
MGGTLKDDRAQRGSLSRRTILQGAAGLIAAAAPLGRAARAQAKPVRIGVLTDMSAWARDAAGPGSVQAANMAVKEFGGTALGRPIEILVGDHQEKVDIGSQIARKWFDEDGVLAIADVPNSAIGIAVHNLARDKRGIALLSGTFSSDVTNQLCSPFTAQFALDTYSLANVAAAAISAEGARSWFFITADFAFGHALEADATAAITKLGGTVLGSVKHPVNNPDFSSFLVRAQASKADVIAIANSASDTVNCIKQAAEFGLVGGPQKIAALLLFLSDIHAVGLKVAQGIYCTTGAYWDLDDRSRAWAAEFYQKLNAMPTDTQAGTYSSVLHYLQAMRAAGIDNPEAVMAKMRELPIDDAFIRGGKLRADGRVIEDLYLTRVKTPSQSTRPWDYLSIQRKIAGDNAFRPLADSKCSLVTKT